ncbi:hypothetical protein SDC9_185540 [bioreactor metagenome]|uniref:HTH gntR-type domain-containing protein n=1 Tax=bioreactor metagenome TaxID=1076179 RepID=A0A645HG55_9ZZZZ
MRGGLVLITVDFKDRKPIYEQLVDNIRTLAIVGLYKADEQLPSVRQLALDLGINPNTIQKAYTELERQGVVYSLLGRGNFISGDLENLLKVRKERVLMQMTEKIKEALLLKIRQDELMRIIDGVYSPNKEGTK